MKKNNTGCLLSANTAQELNLISLNSNQIQAKLKDAKICGILKEYKDVFEGLGKLKDGEVKINIDKEAIVQAQQTRRIPFHIRKKFKEFLKELARQDILSNLFQKINLHPGFLLLSLCQKRWFSAYLC